IADGEHLIDQDHLRVDMDGAGEPEPHEHPRGEELHLRVHELAELGELHDVVVHGVRLAVGRPRNAAFRYTFSLPVSSGWNPAPSSNSPAIRPRCRTTPSLGRRIPAMTDRKSTRLNSSHVAISYAVFCLKKKKVH